MSSRRVKVTARQRFAQPFGEGRNSPPNPWPAAAENGRLWAITHPMGEYWHVGKITGSMCVTIGLRAASDGGEARDTSARPLRTRGLACHRRRRDVSTMGARKGQTQTLRLHCSASLCWNARSQHIPPVTLERHCLFISAQNTLHQNGDSSRTSTVSVHASHKQGRAILSQVFNATATLQSTAEVLA